MAECIRRAWLTLGALTMPLEDEDAGYYCTQLDLGYPTIREVVDNRPDAHGIFDRTSYFGSRVISANITARRQPVDEVASSFGPFMVPSVRPVLHYVLERPGAAEHTMTVRASGYSWPISGAAPRDIQLQWVAADPFAVGATLNKATAWAGSAVAGGRSYPLAFERSYPDATSVPTAAVIASPGDVAVQPYVRIFGPIEAPMVAFDTAADARRFTLTFKPTTRIDAGHFIGVDTAEHTALLDDDPAQPVLSSLDWNSTTWPVCPVEPDSTLMAISGLYATNVTQAEATWYDRFLA